MEQVPHLSCAVWQESVEHDEVMVTTSVWSMITKLITRLRWYHSHLKSPIIKKRLRACASRVSFLLVESYLYLIFLEKQCYHLNIKIQESTKYS